MLKNKSWILLVIFALFGFINTSIPVWAQENTTTQFDNAILASNQQLVVPIGRADTSVNYACQNLIDEIVKCERGNGTCVAEKLRKGNVFTEKAKKCVGLDPNNNNLNEKQKSSLINGVCLALPADFDLKDKIFSCQACIGRGVNPGWTADQVRDKCDQAIKNTPNNNNTSRKLVKLVPDNNGQLKEVLATRINVREVREKPLGVARVTEDNFYLTVANQLINPFSNKPDFVLANTQSQQKTLIIEASEISNVVVGQGIVKSQGEICTFDFFPGEGWQVVTPPANGITNQGVCSTEVTIKPNSNQTAFWGFGGTPVWAQEGSNQPRVEVCVGSDCASVNLNVVGQVIADASTNVLNFFENQCFFPNQTLSDGKVCESDKALSVRIFRLILNVAPVVAFTVALFASFLLLIGKEKEGRSWLGKAIIGLVAIFAITTIVGLIEQSIQQKNVDPITNFVKLAVNSFIIPLASIVSLIYFIIGSYKIVFSGTDEAQVKEGWKYMQNAIIGFVIVLLSFSLAQVIINLFLFVSSTL